MSSKSNTLSTFHKQLGEEEIRLGPWRQNDGQRSRHLRYVTPLKNRLGPRQCLNREKLTAVHTSATAFVVSGQCSSEGVPFGGNFLNQLQWVAVADGPAKTKLHITGACDVFFLNTISMFSV